jgi:hypothetical protein
MASARGMGLARRSERRNDKRRRGAGVAGDRAGCNAGDTAASKQSVAGPRQKATRAQPAHGPGLQNLFCKERATMMTRAGMLDDAGKARALIDS